MLMQLHHQFRDGHTEMIAQQEINNDKEMREFIEEIKVSHPLPDNSQWLACNEKSEFFVGTVDKEENNYQKRRVLYLCLS